MSFLDNTKMFGLLAIIVGIIALVLSVVGGVAGEETGMAMFSGTVGGLMILILGLLVYLGKFSSKPEVVSGYLMIYGAGFVIIGLLNLWGGILNVIVGLIAIFIGYRMYTGQKNGPIWWYILVIIFALLIIGNFISIFGIGFEDIYAILAAVSVVCLFIINIYMLAFLFDKDVKAKFSF